MNQSKDDKIQGEGDYEAARRYRDKVEKFVATHPHSDNANAAKPETAAEGKEMADAEAAGRAKSHGDDSRDVMKLAVPVKKTPRSPTKARE